MEIEEVHIPNGITDVNDGIDRGAWLVDDGRHAIQPDLEFEGTGSVGPLEMGSLGNDFAESYLGTTRSTVADGIGCFGAHEVAATFFVDIEGNVLSVEHAGNFGVAAIGATCLSRNGKGWVGTHTRSGVAAPYSLGAVEEGKVHTRPENE